MEHMNVALVDDAVAEILAKPEGHDQEWWGRQTACSTTKCLAGHIVAQAGWQLDFLFHPVPARDGIISTASTCTKDGMTMDIAHAAMLEAGLSRDDAETLFYCWGKADDVARLWKDIKEQHGQ